MYENLIAKLRGAKKFFPGYLLTAKDFRYELMPQDLWEAADAIEELSRLHEAQRQNLITLMNEDPEMEWIPVAERLPEEGTAVNITWVNHRPVIYYQHIKGKPQTATGVYYRRKWYWWSAVVQDYLAEYGKWEPDEMDAAIEVTHWMPLPEPSKGDE